MRKVMMVLATGLALTGALSVSSAAYAGGSRNDADSSGGYPVGPMGQIFDGVNPVDHPFIFGPAGRAYYHFGGSGENAYGYVGVPHARPHRSHGYERR
jgi:hypothetical protein